VRSLYYYLTFLFLLRLEKCGSNSLRTSRTIKKGCPPRISRLGLRIIAALPPVLL